MSSITEPKQTANAHPFSDGHVVELVRGHSNTVYNRIFLFLAAFPPYMCMIVCIGSALAMTSTQVPIDNAIRPSAAATVPFNSADHLRRLSHVCVEVQRLRTNTSPQGIVLLKGSMKALEAAVSLGMAQAKLVKQKANRDEFVDKMRKIIASSGIPLTTDVASPDVEPSIAPIAPGVRVKPNLAGMVFPDRLPRFVRKWQEGDPEWRLLQCAVRSRRDQTYILGLAETSQQNYSIFHGMNGGNYRTKEVGLHEGQNVMTAAYKLGYMAIAVKDFASKASLNAISHQLHSVVRMTNVMSPHRTGQRA